MADTVRFGTRLTSAARLRRWIAVIAVVAITGIVASSAFDVWRSYQRTMADATRELANVGKALAEQLEGSLQSIDVALQGTASWYASLPPGTEPALIDAGLATRAADVPQIAVLTISDAGGQRRFRSHGSAATDFSVADRDYFTAQRDSTKPGVYVSEPIVTRSDGRVSFVLSRRLQDASGRFAGVVAAIVELREYQLFYRAINLGTGSAIALYRTDGTLVLREPPAPALVGTRFPLVAAEGADASPPSPQPSPGDGAFLLAGVTRVETFPLLVSVARDRSAVLLPWREEALHVGTRTLVIVVLGLAAMIALLRALTRIEHNQRALRESEARYALAMEGANEGHFDWNFEGGASFLSGRMKLLHGRTEHSPVTTREAWMAGIDLHPDDAPALEAAVQAHLAGHTPQLEAEYRVRHADGEWHWLHARGRCVRDARGTVHRFVGSAIDITPRKKAEAENAQLETALRQAHKLEAMGTLASGIAHDFNNILGAILGYGELAQKEAAPGSAARRYLDSVLGAGARAKALVERILAFSRTGVGESELLQVEAVVAEAVELLAASLPPDILLDVRLGSGTAAITGDATQLHQVVMNLGTNALQAMGETGVLSIALDRVDVAQGHPVSHGSLSAGPHVRLCVGDTGSGIEPAVLERIFDPFFTTKGVGKGTGLGLSLVHALVADLHGAIDIVTKVGDGTTFTIWLPVAGDMTAAAAAPLAQLALGNGQAILVVDDEPALVALDEELVAELGYEPVGFTTSADALAAFRAEPARFDLVLTDELMPGLTGSAMAAQMLALRPDLPVILVSGYAGADVQDRARALGIREVLQKPLRQQDIAAALSRALA